MAAISEKPKIFEIRRKWHYMDHVVAWWKPDLDVEPNSVETDIFSNDWYVLVWNIWHPAFLFKFSFSRSGWIMQNKTYS